MFFIVHRGGVDKVARIVLHFYCFVGDYQYLTGVLVNLAIGNGQATAHYVYAALWPSLSSLGNQLLLCFRRDGNCDWYDRGIVYLIILIIVVSLVSVSIVVELSVSIVVIVSVSPVSLLLAFLSLSGLSVVVAVIIVVASKSSPAASSVSSSAVVSLSVIKIIASSILISLAKYIVLVLSVVLISLVSIVGSSLSVASSLGILLLWLLGTVASISSISSISTFFVFLSLDCGFGGLWGIGVPKRLMRVWLQFFFGSVDDLRDLFFDFGFNINDSGRTVVCWFGFFFFFLFRFVSHPDIALIVLIFLFCFGWFLSFPSAPGVSSSRFDFFYFFFLVGVLIEPFFVVFAHRSRLSIKYYWSQRSHKIHAINLCSLFYVLSYLYSFISFILVMQKVFELTLKVGKIPVFSLPHIQPTIITKVEQCKKFNDYVEKFNHLEPGVEVEKIEILHVEMFGQNVGFVTMKAFTSKDGYGLPNYVFMRGHAVCILMLVNDKVLLVEQYRVPVQQTLLEAPAGMIDESGDFMGVAAAEILEETSIKITKEQLVPLGSYYCSPGGSDEELFMYYCQITLSAEELKVIEQKIHGKEGESERIKVKLVDYDSLALLKTKDSKLVYALYAYENLIKGKQHSNL